MKNIAVRVDNHKQFIRFIVDMKLKQITETLAIDKKYNYVCVNDLYHTIPGRSFYKVIDITLLGQQLSYHLDNIADAEYTLDSVNFRTANKENENDTTREN